MEPMLPANRWEEFRRAGLAGSAADVDLLMAALAQTDELATSRLVDYALGLVETPKGRARIRHYLHEGSQQQRNYAALYFKRRNVTYYLEEAVAAGKIDAAQAFSR